VARVSALVSNVSVVPAVAGLPYFVGVPAVACSCCCCFSLCYCFFPGIPAGESLCYVRSVPTVSSVTDVSNVSGVPVILAFLLLLASWHPCHVVDTHTVDGIRCYQRSRCYNVYDFAGDPAVGVIPALAGVLKN
jgi:hypothetical protein